MTEAYEAGDYDKVADAQQAISQIAIEKERLRVQKSRSQAQAVQQQQVQQQQQQPQPRQQQRDPKLESWIGKNKWFGQDKVMTGAARAIHEALVAEEGYDPTSDEYYAKKSTRVCVEKCLKSFRGKKNVQTVTPAWER